MSNSTEWCTFPPLITFCLEYCSRAGPTSLREAKRCEANLRMCVQKLTEGSTYGGDGDEGEKRKKKDKTPPVSPNNPPPAFRSTKYPGTGLAKITKIKIQE